MNLFAQSGWIKLVLVTFLLLLGAGSLIYNNYLVEKILDQERVSVELWAKAIEFNALPVHQQSSSQLINFAITLQKNPNVPDSISQKLFEIESIRSSQDFVTDELILDEAGNFKVPAVLVDSNDMLLGYRNIDGSKLKSAKDSVAIVQSLKSYNSPIKIVLGDENIELSQFVYYGESPTVRLLRYFPYIQIVVLSLLLVIGYTTYKSITRTEQSNLWVGMAKEAAHQLGTPISSLYGWIQLFKDEFQDHEEGKKIIQEIENDVQRLSGVAERFGKIGSSPELELMSIKPNLDEVVDYMERRLPKLGKVVEVRKSLRAEAQVKINSELFQWAIENLLKNAIDALNNSSKAYVSITSKVKGKEVIIDIEDSGSGIEINQFKTVFRPGFSTKKRGWGLGLSLTKRIIEEYHSGKVFVHKSEVGVGTTMRIVLKVQG